MTTETSYCRRERRDTPWIPTGSQNGTRPAASFWRCSSCGLDRVEMENVFDVEALAAAIVAERRRSATADADSAKLDYEDAVGHVTEAIIVARVEWDRDRNASFLSYATWRGRNALSDWYRNQLGRDTPKAHAWSVSLDAMTTGGDRDDGEGVALTVVGAVAGLADASIDHAIVLIEDGDSAETLRSIVAPIAEGYSHAEVAARIGVTEAAVSARLRKLRARDDLRA